jgi:hypothetical protein
MAESSEPWTDAQWAAALAEATTMLGAVAAAGETITYVRFVSGFRTIDLNDRYDDLQRFLGDVSEAEERAGRGLLSAVVVGTRTGIPGKGFFSLARRLGRSGTDRSIWEAERTRLQAVWANQS